jgi:hypothetical protein
MLFAMNICIQFCPRLAKVIDCSIIFSLEAGASTQLWELGEVENTASLQQSKKWAS